MSLWMLLSVPALAQSTEDEEQAKALYAQGEEAYAEEEYEQALKYWGAAYDLSGRPLILYNMASAYEKLGRYPEAIESLDEYWRFAPESERGIIERRIKSLEAKLDPGQESPATNATGRVSGGGLSIDPAWVLVGVGVAGLGTGTYFGLQSRTGSAELAIACPTGLCTGEQSVLLTKNRQDSLIADTALLVGIAAAGTGVTLLLIDDGGLYVSPTPNGFLVGGRFQ
ncbi:MAG: tetratricopeptide (TPR) repeat protein [Cognaticolwellia sp.]|jgi:tetratricopeptide (TPR) repeat protein